jgi:hypothetical protein
LSLQSLPSPRLTASHTAVIMSWQGQQLPPDPRITPPRPRNGRAEGRK